MRGRPSISAVVCTRGAAPMLPRCLDALASQSLPKRLLETIVVLNGATPEAGARARRLAGAPARLIEVGLPGLSRARNEGVAAARSPVVAFTDDDVIVERGWAEALLRAFDDPSVDGAFGLVRGPQGVPFPICEKTDPLPGVAVSPESLWRLGHGNNMAWRRGVLEGAGLFDERLGAGTPNRAAEDVDLAYRILSRGGRIAYVPGAAAEHVPDLACSGPGERLKGYDVGAAAFAAKHAAAGDLVPAMLVLGRMKERASMIRGYLPFSPVALWRDQRGELLRWGAMLAAAARNFGAYLPPLPRRAAGVAA